MIAECGIRKGMELKDVLKFLEIDPDYLDGEGAILDYQNHLNDKLADFLELPKNDVYIFDGVFLLDSIQTVNSRLFKSREDLLMFLEKEVGAKSEMEEIRSFLHGN